MRPQSWGSGETNSEPPRWNEPWQQPGPYMPGPAVGYGGVWYQDSPARPVPGGRCASMGARFGGLVIDWIVVLVPSVLISLFTGGVTTGHSITCSTYSGLCTQTTTYQPSWTFQLLFLLFGLVYFSYFVGVRGRTLGHRTVGIRVVDLTTNSPIGVPRVALRWIILLVTGAVCTLGF